MNERPPIRPQMDQDPIPLTPELEAYYADRKLLWHKLVWILVAGLDPDLSEIG